MADERDTIAVIAEEFGFAFEPLAAAFSLPGALRDFLDDLGWDFATAPTALSNLKAPVEQVFSLVQGGGIDASGIPRLLDTIRGAFAAISDLRNEGGLANDFKNEFPGQLAQYLLVEYFLNRQPKWGRLLMSLGVIRLEETPAAGGRPAYLRRVFAFQDFNQLFNDPLVFFKNGYQWGQSNFAGEKLLTNLHSLLTAWGFETRPESLDANTLNSLNNGALQPQDAYDLSLHLALIEDSEDAARFSAGVGVFLLPETAASKPGFALLPVASGEFAESVDIANNLTLGFQGGVDLAGGAGILVRPNRDVEFLLGLASGTPAAASGNLAVVLRLANPGSPFVLIGSPGASRIEVAGVSTTGGTRFFSNGKYDVFTEFALEKGKIVIKPGAGQADGFLAQLLPGNGMQIEFDLTVGFSTAQGLYFGGSGGLEISLPVHIQIGPIEIQSALLAVHFKDGGIPVEVAATIKGDLSVLKAVVENVGLKANFTFPADGKGNLGPVNLALAFRPPNGVGLALDAGVIKGGGFLSLDFDKGEYAGALEFTFSGFISLKAIGLITTRMPDGSNGFSLLIIITAEFGTGIQLGFGFTLLAVGGLIGLNRTMRLERIAEGIRTGGINSIMFPQDVIANAPRIISDLRNFFPPEEGKFLIGPMAKIGWGTPTLISLSLGIIIEIPGNIAILGVLRVALPTEDAALLVLQVSFLGAIEFDKKRVWFFATLFESRVLFITIEGEMGLLVAFGDDANFVVSVGGFHPRFNPPPLPFATPRRVAFDVINTPTYLIRVEGYFAVTTNTAQFGAKAQLRLGFDDFGVQGHIAFDALFQFSPFYFIIEISASVSLKAFGVGLFSIRLRFSLEGPTPWRAKGSGSISLFFFEISADFDFTWGETRDTALPPIAVMPLLGNEYKKLDNWNALLPAGSNLLVSLRKLEPSPDNLVLHPVGTLRISQKAVPLDLPIDKVGNQKPNDARRFTLTVAVGGLAKKADTIELFAPAQFEKLDDAARLSRPAFEPEHGGLELSAAGQDLASSRIVKRNVRYEEIIIDTNFKRFVRRFSEYFGSLFTHFLAGNAVSKSTLSQHSKQQLQPFDEKIKVNPDLYVIAFQSNNRAVSTSATFISEASARAFLRSEAAQDAALADSLHVIPGYEVNAG